MPEANPWRVEKFLDRVLSFAGVALLVAVGLAWFLTPILLDADEPDEKPAIEAARKPGVAESRRPQPGDIVKIASRRVPGRSTRPLAAPTRGPAGSPPSDTPIPVRQPGLLPDDEVTTRAWLLDPTYAYEGPALNRRILARLESGEQVRFIRTEGEWDEVLLSGRGRVWLPAKHLTFDRPGEAGMSPAQSAVEVVRRFYQALDQRDLGKAYGYLSRSRRQEVPYETFERIYAGLSGAQVRIDRVFTDQPGEAVVEVTAELNDFDGPRTYQGRVVLVEEGTSWKVRSASLL